MVTTHGRVRALHRGARVYAQERHRSAYETQDVLVSTPRSCGRRVLTPLGCRRSPPLCVSAAATGLGGGRTIGGRCVELDAEEISLVSRAVVVVPSVTVSVVVGRRSLLRSLPLSICPLFVSANCLAREIVLFFFLSFLLFSLSTAVSSSEILESS